MTEFVGVSTFIGAPLAAGLIYLAASWRATRRLARRCSNSNT